MFLSLSRVAPLNALVLTCLLGAFAPSVGCGPGPGTTDAGDENPDEDEDAGQEEDQCRADGQSCHTDDSECCDGLTCVPSPLQPDTGACRAQCGSVDAQGNPSKDEAADCGAGRSCQVIIGVTAAGNLAATDVVCLPPVSDRDEACAAYADPEACTDDRSCQIVDITQDGASVSLDLGCKDVCRFGTSAADDACEDGEICFGAPLPVVADELQLSDPANPNSVVACILADCAEGGTNCTCDTANGFECAELATQDLCVRYEGQCGVPVRTVTLEDLQGTPGDNIICNNVDDHLICDDRAYRDLDNPASLLCLGISRTTNDGICAAFCKQFAFDYDGNGSIEAGEGAQDTNCPSGFECTLEFARELGIGAQVTESNGQDRACDATACPAGQPCAACGDSAECVDYTASGLGHLCTILFGTCQPPAPTDGGVADAGQATDSGVADAGDVDAGTADDAGSTDDAGDADAGTIDDAGTADDAGNDPDSGNLSDIDGGI